MPEKFLKRLKYLQELYKKQNNIGDKESSSDLETGAEPHRLELEERIWVEAGLRNSLSPVLFP